MTPAAPATPLPRVLAAFALAWAVLDRTATWTGSVLGEAGLLVGAAAVGAAWLGDAVVLRHPWRGSLRELGFRAPARRALLPTAAAAAILLAYFPAFAAATGTPLALRPGALALVPGLFAQGGVGEETVFRGLLYGHLRQTRPFWRAAALSTIPFVAVHLLAFATLPWPVAAASLALSAIVAFPLARLFDLGGASVWPPALLHFVVQGAVKLVVVPDDRLAPLAVGWMAASAVVPWMVFALRAYPTGARDGRGWIT